MSSRALLDPETDRRPETSTLRSVVLYLFVGLLSFATDFTIYSLLVGYGGGIHPLVANCISRPLGGFVCFFANKYWTFGNRSQKPASTQFIRFWCVFLMSLGLSEGLIWLFHDVLDTGPRSAKLIAEAVCVVFNYLCLRLWTFR